MSDGNDFATRHRHFVGILKDLFDPTPHMTSVKIFEFICTLVRAGGLELGNFDPWYESKAIVDDLSALAEIDLPVERFPEPGKTRLRLALVSYCTLTEMDLPYVLIANLIRLRLGQKYQIDPFRDLWQRRAPQKGSPFGTNRPPTTSQKLRRITELAEAAKIAAIGEALKEVHDAAIRNAVFHSDFILGDDSLLIRKASRLSKKENVHTPRVPLEELNQLITDAFAFYGALFALHEQCVGSFRDFKYVFLPYDVHYKGLMECLFGEADRLIGFRVYWPNGTTGWYSRTKDACVGQNLHFEADDSINFMVGVYASKPGTFSPLVEYDAEPVYATRPGTEIRPYWPDDLKPYRLP